MAKICGCYIPMVVHGQQGSFCQTCGGRKPNKEYPNPSILLNRLEIFEVLKGLKSEKEWKDFLGMTGRRLSRYIIEESISKSK